MVGNVVGLKKNCFMWTLTPYDIWVSNENIRKELKSDKFSMQCVGCNAGGTHEWILYFYPRGKSGSSDKMGLYLCLVSTNVPQGIVLKVA